MSKSIQDRIDGMIKELEAAGVEIDLESPMSAALFNDHIIHLYDVFICPVSYQFVEETAFMVYKCRKNRGATWTKAWRSNK